MSGADQTPTLVCLIGPPAVGKMTVGQEICRRTGFKLFHGHVVADLLTQYFPFDAPPYVRLGQTWRRLFYEEALQAGLNLVMTTAWRFDMPEDAETMWSWLQPYVEGGGRVLCVELLAPLEVRLERNRTENRRRHKNAYWVTDAYLQEIHTAHRYDSDGAFPFDLPHLRINTTTPTAEATAERICEHFHLPQSAGGHPSERLRRTL